MINTFKSLFSFFSKNKSSDPSWMNPNLVLTSTVKNPKLIQRCMINEIPNETSPKSLSDVLKFDYMGSSEFEWGIVPSTLEALNCKKKKLKVFKTDINDLFVLCLPSQLEEYSKVLAGLVNKTIQTKEYVFPLFNTSKKIDLWIDLDNQVVFSTSQEFLNKINISLDLTMIAIRKNQKAKIASDKLMNKYNLNSLVRELGGVGLSGNRIDSNKGTMSLKDQTKYDVVFWFNGPHINGQWLCGYYTVESLIEYTKFKTGALADAYNHCKDSKRKQK